MQEMRVQPLGREDPLEKEMQLTPVFLLGRPHGERSLVGCSLWSSSKSNLGEFIDFSIF